MPKSLQGSQLFLQLLVEQLHCIDLGLLCNIYIRFHGLVVGVAGPFHDNLRWDAAGEGEADEGAAAGMGAYHLILGEGLFDTVAATVADPGDGLVESGQLAKVLQVAVHELVRQYRQCTAKREFLVLVLVQDGLGETVQVDGQAVVGLDGGHVHRVPFDVRLLEVGQIGIPERGEGTEAEAVLGLLHTAGILYLLLVLLAVHVKEFHLGAVLGDLEVVQVQQLFLSEEDDRLLQDLELGPVRLDGKLMAVALADGPVQEPAQVVELLLDTLLLQAALGLQALVFEIGLSISDIFEAVYSTNLLMPVSLKVSKVQRELYAVR